MSTGTETKTGLINLDDLLDAYMEPLGEGFDFEYSRPTLWRIEVDGVKWLTDKHWLLPEDRCVFDDDWDIKQLREEVLEKNAAKVSEWVTTLRDGLLTPSKRPFAPTFAGVLTRAGYSAHDFYGADAEPPFAALVDSAEERVGLLMPYRHSTERCAPIPSSAEFLAMFKRLHDEHIARDWHCWEFAALLTGGVL